MQLPAQASNWDVRPRATWRVSPHGKLLFTRDTRRAMLASSLPSISVAACVGLIGCAPIAPHGSPSNRASAETRDAVRARAAHVLGRLTFGPRPGDVERVLQLGIDRWIDRQLHPESIADSAAM